MGADCGDNSVAFGFVLLGMGCAVIASLGSTFGLILQKLAQMKNDALPENEKFPTSGGIIWSPTWILGLLLLIILPFPLDLAAFSLAPQSLVVPLSGVTLVLNQVIAPSVLKEKVSCLDWIATGVITCGIVCSTAFGSHCSVEFTVDEIMDLFQELPFQIAEGVFVFSMIVACWWLNWGAYSYCTSEDRLNRSRSVVFGYAAGAVGGQQQIFLKATGELFESTFNGNAEWDRWEAWFFTITCVILAVAQIQLLNKGMALWTAIKYLPIYNVCLILCSTTYGGIFYEEYKVLSTEGFILFPFGVAVVVLGAVLLGCKNDVGVASAVVVPESPVKGDIIYPVSEKAKDEPHGPLRGMLDELYAIQRQMLDTPRAERSALKAQITDMEFDIAKLMKGRIALMRKEMDVISGSGGGLTHGSIKAGTLPPLPTRDLPPLPMVFAFPLDQVPVRKPVVKLDVKPDGGPGQSTQGGSQSTQGGRRTPEQRRTPERSSAAQRLRI
eukprot:TRINITY_DN4999_c0_g1_i2.p1 TRINITY_DN4999_c0_g1~~TRINITY_DN4999_c0_g1_i2.p1  ORF type:complete len:497 (+),score=98.26 TRINITY_DN4999_c0_g1_i2:195-1685(+)